jgi:hypothetical protein
MTAHAPLGSLDEVMQVAHFELLVRSFPVKRCVEVSVDEQSSCSLVWIACGWLYLGLLARWRAVNRSRTAEMVNRDSALTYGAFHDVWVQDENIRSPDYMKMSPGQRGFAQAGSSGTGGL